MILKVKCILNSSSRLITDEEHQGFEQAKPSYRRKSRTAKSKWISSFFFLIISYNPFYVDKKGKGKQVAEVDEQEVVDDEDVSESNEGNSVYLIVS